MTSHPRAIQRRSRGQRGASRRGDAVVRRPEVLNRVDSGPLTALFSVVLFIVEVMENFFEDDCPQRAAAVAYYSVLSLPALLILVVTLGSAFLDADVVANAIQQRAETMVAPRATQQLIRMVDRASGWASTGPWWAVALSIFGLLFGATRAFAQLQTALNRAWGIRPKPQNVLRRFLVKRLVSFGALAIMAGLLLVSILLKAIVGRFEGYLAQFLPVAWTGVLQWATGHTLSIVFATGFLASLYWLLPDAKISLWSVLPGALLTSVLFEGVSSLFSVYLGTLELDDAFGQAGSFAVLLIWLYLCALLLFFGAQFTQVWTRWRGRPVRPDSDEPDLRKSATSVVGDFLNRRWGSGSRDPK